MTEKISKTPISSFFSSVLAISFDIDRFLYFTRGRKCQSYKIIFSAFHSYGKKCDQHHSWQNFVMSSLVGLVSIVHVWPNVLTVQKKNKKKQRFETKLIENDCKDVGARARKVSSVQRHGKCLHVVNLRKVTHT